MIYSAHTLLLTLKGYNCKIEAIRLNTFTDYTDTVVNIKTVYKMQPFGEKGRAPECEGNIFILYDYDFEISYQIITFAADFEVPSLYVKDDEVYLNKGNFEVEILTSDLKSAKKNIRKYLKSFTRKKLVTMSNTWGDGNSRSRVCEEFVKKEIDVASEIGIDCVQIDDGWQYGDTGDMSRRDANGKRVFADDFWREDTKKFPKGIKEIGEYAKEKGVIPGLWFAPDYHSHFATSKRDEKILKNKHDECGVEFIKLDMLFVFDDEDKRRFIEFCEELKKHSLLELDVTYGQRLGYLLSMKQGIVFLENRYTKGGNYIPSRTLKNLWELGEYIPLQSLQAEVSNPDLNKEKFSTPFASENYSFDYLFALTCFANPLFWCEIQFLTEKRRNELLRIFPVWKNIRDNIATGVTASVGEIPTGRSFTGFMSYGKKNYGIFFRELTEKDTFTFELEKDFSSANVLATNCHIKLNVEKDKTEITFSQQNGYVLVEFE